MSTITKLISIVFTNDLEGTHIYAQGSDYTGRTTTKEILEDAAVIAATEVLHDLHCNGTVGFWLSVDALPARVQNLIAMQCVAGPMAKEGDRMMFKMSVLTPSIALTPSMDTTRLEVRQGQITKDNCNGDMAIYWNGRWVTDPKEFTALMTEADAPQRETMERILRDLVEIDSSKGE